MIQRSARVVVHAAGIGRTGVAALAAVVFSLLIATSASSFSADVARYLVKTETGAYEERSVEGTIVGVSPDGVTIEPSSEKNAPDENPIPTERVVWLHFQDAPLSLAAARVETEIGNYEEALEKLAEIEPDEIDRSKKPLIAAELDWYRAYTNLQLALTGAKPFSEGGNLMMNFVKEHSDSYRFYEANQLLGAAFFALSERQNKKSAEQNLKRAKDAYSALEKASSEEIQTRGRLGLAKIAFNIGDLEEAKSLFSEAARRDDFTLEFSEARIGLARVLSRQGSADEATAVLNELLIATPNDATQRQARIYNALGDVCAESDRPQEAVVAYLHVDLLYPAARTERVAALQALVSQWRKLGREDRAQETIERLRERFHVEVKEDKESQTQ